MRGMNRKLRKLNKLFVGAFLWASAALPAYSQGVSVVDDTGTKVAFDQPVKRIISLAPHTTEMLFSVGAGEQVVGAVEYSDYPEAAKKIPRVGGYSQFDMEAIVAMQPDLVVAWNNGNPAPAIEKIKSLGLPLYLSEPKSFEGVASNMERLAILTGHEEQGKSAAGAFREELARLKKTYAGQKSVTVFYQIWNKPLMTINGDHLITKVMELCGGKNIFAELPVTAPQVDVEAVLLRNPQAIIASGMAANRPDWLDEWKNWPHLSAVQTNSIYTIHPDLIQRHSPRILQGAEHMCQHLAEVRKKTH